MAQVFRVSLEHSRHLINNYQMSKQDEEQKVSFGLSYEVLGEFCDYSVEGRPVRESNWSGVREGRGKWKK